MVSGVRAEVDDAADPAISDCCDDDDGAAGTPPPGRAPLAEPGAAGTPGATVCGPAAEPSLSAGLARLCPAREPDGFGGATGG